MPAASRAGLTGLRSLLADVRQFAPPWVPMSLIGVPCFTNLYGIILFRQHWFFNNKPSENAGRYAKAEEE